MKQIILFSTITVIFSGFFPIAIPAQNLKYPYENSKMMQVDSFGIHYRVWEAKGVQKGKVLFVHGFGGSTYNFRKNIDTVVASGYKVVAIDLPGFGYSERNVKINQSQSNRSRMLWVLLKNIDNGDSTGWNLIGHSMGGGTVEAMALTNPASTRSLTIIDGMLLKKSDAIYMYLLSKNISKLRNNVMVSYTRKNFITYKNVEKRLKSVYGFSPDSAMVLSYLIPLEISGTAETFVNLIANAEEITPFNVDILKTLSVLVVWGKKDKTIGVGKGKSLKRKFPSIDLHVIPDAYHMPMETHPLIFNQILLTFLNSKNPLPSSRSR